MSTKRLEEFLNLPETRPVIPNEEQKEPEVVVKPDLKPESAPDGIDTSVSIQLDERASINSFYTVAYPSSL